MDDNFVGKLRMFADAADAQFQKVEIVPGRDDDAEHNWNLTRGSVGGGG